MCIRDSKYRVRDYVDGCGCGGTLNRLLAVYDRPEDIDLSLIHISRADADGEEHDERSENSQEIQIHFFRPSPRFGPVTAR